MFTKSFALNLGWVASDNTIYCLSISWSLLKVFTIKVQSCPKRHALWTLDMSKWANRISWLVDQRSSKFLCSTQEKQ